MVMSIKVSNFRTTVLSQCFKLLNYCSTANECNYLKAAIHAIVNEVHVFQKYYRVHKS